MSEGFRTGIGAVGLAALIALAGCGGDDDSKSDAAGTTGTEKPSRGFEQGTGSKEPRLFVLFATWKPGGGHECSRYVLSRDGTGGKCELGLFEDHDASQGNSLSPFATSRDGRPMFSFERPDDSYKTEFTAVRSGDDPEPYARLVGEGPPLTYLPKQVQGDQNGPPPDGGSGTTSMTVTDGTIPKWGAINVRSGTDPDEAGREGGPLKVTVRRLPPTDDSIFYTIELEGFLTYDAAPGDTQN